MRLRLRPGAVANAEECGRIEYEAFKSIAVVRRQLTGRGNAS